MILQALTDYYEVMAARGLAAPEGWCRAKVNFALVLEEDGTLSGLMNLKEQQEDGTERPRVLTVPEQEKRTSDLGHRSPLSVRYRLVFTGDRRQGQSGTSEEVLCRQCGAAPEVAGQGG